MSISISVSFLLLCCCSSMSVVITIGVITSSTAEVTGIACVTGPAAYTQGRTVYLFLFMTE